MTSNETPRYESAMRHGQVRAPSGGPPWRALKVAVSSPRRGGIARSDAAATEDRAVSAAATHASHKEPIVASSRACCRIVRQTRPRTCAVAVEVFGSAAV